MTILEKRAKWLVGSEATSIGVTFIGVTFVIIIAVIFAAGPAASLVRCLLEPRPARNYGNRPVAARQPLLAALNRGA